MFSRLSRPLSRSAKAFNFQSARRFTSPPNKRLQRLGCAVLGLSSISLGLVSSSLLSQPKDEVQQLLDIMTKSTSKDDFDARVKALEKTIYDMSLEDFKESLRDAIHSFDSREVEIPKSVKNTAFVFIKPHAVTDAVVDLVESNLKSRDITIIDSGEISGEEIDDKMLIDQHYYSIASKATLLKPEKLNVPPAKFQNKFGLAWGDALKQGIVYNAKDACEFLGLDSSGLNSEWAKCKKEGRMIKFGGGFYCGLINSVPNKPPIYVFNGFFMAMRNKFVAPGSKIKYFVVEWDAKKLSWEDFRGDVLGPTDPVTAPEDSLRGLVFKNWSELGLSSTPNVGDNAVHASASPFEALAERMNWLQANLASDSFGKLLLEAGVPEKLIQEWSVDPQVIYGSRHLPIKMSLFDSLEDTDSDLCLALSKMISRGAQ